MKKFKKIHLVARDSQETSTDDVVIMHQMDYHELSEKEKAMLKRFEDWWNDGGQETDEDEEENQKR